MAVEDMLNDIRFEQQKQAADIQIEANKNAHDVITAAGNNTDTLTAQVTSHQQSIADRLFAIGRDTQDIRAQIISAQQAMVTGFLGVSKDAEIQALKTQMETSKQTTYLSDKLDADGEKTRALINDLKYNDLNRALVERNSELVEERWGRRYWRDFAGQNQYAALSNQLQAFGSQLNDTRNSMVNFGTQLGVGQRATSNNVG
jgi:hypothetical protein